MNEGRIYRDPTDGNEYMLLGDGLRKKIWRDFFTYEFPVFSNLAALGAQQQQTVTIQADSDFEWTHGAYSFSLANAAFTWDARPIPNMSAQIVDQGSGRYLSNAAVPIENLFGSPWQPFCLPLTRVFKANATIQVIATNFDAAVATGQLRLAMIGWKIFYY